MSRRSTETNLCEFTQLVSDSMDQGFQMDVVYTDYSKAFDKISHSLLIRKLSEYGIHGDLLRWLESYLRSRSQAVTIKGYCSSFVPISSGVPQGSHLGPLLFLIFINDVFMNFIHSKCLIYADDTKIFMKISSVSDCLLLQSDLSRLVDYCVDNSLFLNTKKCHVISFCRKPKPIIFDYKFNDSIISRVSVIRDLGVYLDSKLTFNAHYESITSRAYRMLGFILRVGRVFEHPSTLLLLYNSFVRSVLEYSSSVWNPQYIVHIDNIEWIQNKFLKHCRYRFPSDSIDYILSLEDRRRVKDQILLFKILSNVIESPFLLQNIFFHCPRPSSRKKKTFWTPASNTNYRKNMFLSRACDQFNDAFSDIDIFNTSLYKFRKDVILSIANR